MFGDGVGVGAACLLSNRSTSSRDTAILFFKHLQYKKHDVSNGERDYYIILNVNVGETV